MNMQETYFKVRNHLLTQGRRAKIYDQCRYRAPNGDKCAIGCLIPDDKYDPNMEGHLISCSPLIQDAIGASEDHIDFLTDLQRVHDFSNPSEWNERLQAVALQYKLEPIQTITVDRNTWARAGANKGDSLLLNDQGNMCCLGFAEEQLGVPKSALECIFTPQQVGVKNLLTSPIANQAVSRAVYANDRPMSGALREAKIKEAFRNILNFEFKGLPDTLSDLLRVAVQDAMILEKTPGFKLNMSNWVLPFNGECHVCMAGACMVKELGIAPPPLRASFPEDVKNYRASRKLYAIDSMRQGDVDVAAKYLKLDLTEAQGKVIEDAGNFIALSYINKQQRATWRTYQKASRMLREAGL